MAISIASALLMLFAPAFFLANLSQSPDDDFSFLSSHAFQPRAFAKWKMGSPLCSVMWPPDEIGALVPLVRQDRQRMEFDAFLVQRLGFLGRGLAVDRAVLDLAVVHLARFLGKFRADMVCILGQ